MTPQEALKEITSKKKWYITKQDHTGNTNRVSALRILNGTAESGAMKRFFSQYEYDVKIVVEKNRYGKGSSF